MFQFGSNSYATVALLIHLMYLISPLHNHLSVLIGLFLCGEGFQRAMKTIQLLISHLKEVILKMSSTYIIVIVLCSHLPSAVRMVAASMFLLVSFLPLNLPFLFHCVCVCIFLLRFCIPKRSCDDPTYHILLEMIFSSFHVSANERVSLFIMAGYNPLYICSTFYLFIHILMGILEAPY